MYPECRYVRLLVAHVTDRTQGQAKDLQFTPQQSVILSEAEDLQFAPQQSVILSEAKDLQFAPHRSISHRSKILESSDHYLFHASVI